MQLSTVESILVPKNAIQFLVLLPVFYFNLAFLISLLAGYKPTVYYYSFPMLDRETLLFVMNLNVVYMVAFLFFSTALIPQRVTLVVRTAWPLLLAAALYIWASTGGNIGLERSIIKSGGTNIVHVILLTAAQAYLASVLLCTKSKWMMAFSIATLLLTVITTFERESILYLVFPIFLRLGGRKFVLPLLLIFMAASAVLLGGYKFLMVEAVLSQRSALSVILAPEFSEYVANSLMVDNLHTSALQLFFFQGDAPNYRILTYLMPIQVLRFLDPSILTNGQLASLYYTQGYSGTGFSALLEGWLNFWFLAPLLVPLLLLLALRHIGKMKSAILFVTALIFILKIQRGDFWPTFITIALGPSVFFLLGRFLYSSRLFRALPGMPNISWRSNSAHTGR